MRSALLRLQKNQNQMNINKNKVVTYVTKLQEALQREFAEMPPFIYNKKEVTSHVTSSLSI